MVATPTAQASHNFADVPDSAFYHNQVDFLVDNQITSGCQVTPPLYCPEQPVARGSEPRRHAWRRLRRASR
jgi:hypothetical protein